MEIYDNHDSQTAACTFQPNFCQCFQNCHSLWICCIKSQGSYVKAQATTWLKMATAQKQYDGN
jgi:hypothetical protein